MASESTAKVVEEKAPSAVPKDRRYVGSKETFAYILDDIAQSFNIGKYDDIFKMNIPSGFSNITTSSNIQISL
mgnify:CR=1 FL=1